jgi:hypothetical protein
MRYDGKEKPKVTFHTPENAPKQKMFQGKYTLADIDAKQAAETTAAQPALEQNALMDFYIAKHDAEKEQARLDEQRKEEKKIAYWKQREAEDARVVEECRKRKEKKQREAELNAAFQKIDEALQAVEASDQEIQQIRTLLKATDQNLLSKTSWLAGLLQVRMGVK